MTNTSGNGAKLPRGRFAPSPTGFIHLGNAWSFLLAWLACRSRGGQMVLRMEDLDPQRSRPEFAQAILRDLSWLVLDWDEGPDKGGPHAPYVQSGRSHLYEEAVARLRAEGLVYPCYCTRKELRALASAPHAGEAGPAYPGTCAGLSEEECRAREAFGRRPALRLRCPPGEGGEERFVDLARGELCLSPAGLGDFAVRRSDHVWAYQLAVVVDDAAMGVTQVVRGEDLLDSTPGQVRLFRLLGHVPPEFLHVPLLVDEEGERLAKRHASLTLAALREAGVAPEAVVGWLGRAAGFLPAPAPCAARDLLPLFVPGLLPRGPVTVPKDILERLRALS
ncbi:Glutamyl-Q tRNA(Asp) synthetase [Desulfovibrio sp. X2]|uniref:tRNA glutamyl-Q(34) synthetase GluQRS n=1 Tax=Desulfovibrio sp. X2 TaxID=941449 RepID=UPI00035894EB|nr:tRNA glutamyl-Q(34) synthetase GluQRS [Desulfovibrio sp. X2]EPR37485.1 Glutamyl-Q tRNA(Asp) synthetase [Desulfovibrio sp. X2]